MDDCTIIVRYRGSVTMLKHHPPGRVNACEKPSRPPKDTSARAREGARRSSNSITVLVERVRAPTERLSHYLVIKFQRLSAQTYPCRRSHARTILRGRPFVATSHLSNVCRRAAYCVRVMNEGHIFAVFGCDLASIAHYSSGEPGGGCWGRPGTSATTFGVAAQ